VLADAGSIPAASTNKIEKLTVLWWAFLLQHCCEPTNDNAHAGVLAGEDGKFPPPPPTNENAQPIGWAFSFNKSQSCFLRVNICLIAV